MKNNNGNAICMTKDGGEIGEGPALEGGQIKKMAGQGTGEGAARIIRERAEQDAACLLLEWDFDEY